MVATKVNIARLLKSKGERMEWEIESPLSIKEIPFKGDVSGVFSLTNVGSGILVQGKVTLSIPLSCSRCLEEFLLPLEGLPIEEEFVHRTAFPEREDVTPDELCLFTYGDDYTIDLADLIRQSTISSLPIQPLCSPQCLGLCSTCGVNLNERACPCRSKSQEAGSEKSPGGASSDSLSRWTGEEAADRWKALKQLDKKLD